MAKILVNYPTRSRPHKFMNIMRGYTSKASGKNEIHFFIKVDHDDLTLNNSKMKQFVENLGVSYTWQVMTDCKGKIDAINRDVSNHEFDFVVCVADDIEVLEQDWDQILVDDFKGNYDRALNYNIDIRLKDFKTLIILPIIGRTLFDRYNTIYHPDYSSEYCDNEQTEVFEKAGVLTHIDRHVFKHDWAGNQDTLMSRNMQIGFSLDRELFQKRKEAGFPVGSIKEQVNV